MKNWNLELVGPIAGTPGSLKLPEKRGLIIKYKDCNIDMGRLHIELGTLVGIYFCEKLSDYSGINSLVKDQEIGEYAAYFYIAIPDSEELEDIKQLAMAMKQKFRPVETLPKAGEYRKLYGKNKVTVSVAHTKHSQQKWTTSSLGALQEIIGYRIAIPQDSSID